MARGDVLDQLQQDYARIKAYEALRSIQVLCIKVASNTIIDWIRYMYQVELMFQEHAALRPYIRPTRPCWVEGVTASPSIVLAVINLYDGERAVTIYSLYINTYYL